MPNPSLLSAPVPNAIQGVSRRSALQWVSVAGMTALAGCAGSWPRPAPVAAAPGARLRLIGEATLPHRLDFQGTTVGGLSGLDHDPATGRWFAICDDRSDLQPARFYTLRLALTAQGLAPPELLGAVTLRQPDGTPYPRRQRAGDGGLPPGRTVPDPESIRWRPETGTLLWTSEGDARLGLPPFVREVRTDGTHMRELRLPEHLRFDLSGQTGPRDNLTLEGLAISPGGRSVWAAMEAPLVQDGLVPAVGAPGGPCRITRWDLASGEPASQIAYRPDAIPQPSVPAGAYADNGISEILMVDGHRMLVLERAYMTGVGNSLRLYEVDVRDADDTLALPALHADGRQAVRKTLMADFATLGLSRLDNTEGMCWGPVLPGGRRTLVVVSDDNFNPRQVTQFAAFEYLEHP